MVTLSLLVSEYGHSVDKGLIAAIWAEQGGDEARCRDIVRMLSNHSSTSDSSITMSADGSEAERLVSPSASERSETISSSWSPRPELHTRTLEPTSVEAITSPQALVEFLAACFPECGSDYLSTKVQDIFGASDSKFQVDPIEAIDIISNAFYNDTEAVETQQYHQSHNVAALTKTPTKVDTSVTSLAAIEAQYSVSSSKGKGRKRKGKSRGTQLPASLRKTNAQQDSGGNAWSAISMELGSLCSIFPSLSVNTVKSTYHACGAHIDQTVERLSEIVESNSPSPRSALQSTPKSPTDPHTNAVRALSQAQKKQMRQTADMLQVLFADIPITVLERAALDTHNADAAAERVLVLKEEEEKAAQNSIKSKKPKWKPAEELANYHVGVPIRPQPGTFIDAVYDVTERVPLNEISGDARVWVARNPRDPEYCRKRAELLIAQRNELYSKAARAYTRRNNLHHSGETALYYSTEGHKHDAQARVWRMRAAQASVAAMKRRNTNIVDLHGLTRAEAVAVVHDAVASWYSCAASSDKTGVRSLHIVTGLGNHSIGGRACIHPSVVRLLNNGNWKYVEGDGYIDVVGARKGGPTD
ncbi:hypothetical protein IW147_000054 [Coemansia sp. RSA 720]|nr:hypothetical protein IW147_000054 [Coemansia sp. RSA 720]